MKKLCCLVLAVALGSTSANADCVADYEQSIRPFNESHAQDRILLAQMDSIFRTIKKNRPVGPTDNDLQKLAHIQELLCTSADLKMALVPNILSIAAGCGDLRSQRASAIKERDKLENFINTVCKKAPTPPASADTARDQCNSKDSDLRIQGCTALIKQNLSNALAAIAYNNRGIAYDDKGDHDRAMADYNQAIRLDPKDASHYFNRGNAYQDKNDNQRAIADYTKAIALDPKLIQAYFKRGMSYESVDNYDVAITDLTKAIELRPEVAVTYIGRANAYDQKNDYDHAIADYTKAIELDPNDSDTFRFRGNVYKEKHDYNRAIADFNKAITFDPKEAKNYFGRGDAYDEVRKYDEAIADYTKAIELDPNYGEAYDYRGITHKHKRDYDRAITDFAKAIALDPKRAILYFNRGDASDDKGDYDLAIADYTKAIELDPKYADAYHYRGISFDNKHDYDRAIADYNKAIEINPKDSSTYFDRGNAYKDKSAYEPAIADYTKAIELDPKYKKAYNSRAYSYSESGNYDRAIADYSKTIELDPKQAGPYNSRAWTFFKAGKAAQGLPDVEHALELRPNDANALDTRGNIFETMGRKDEAIADYRKALSINPDMKGSAEGMTRLGAARGNTDPTNGRVDLSPRPAVAKQGKAEAPLPAPDQSTNPGPGSIAPPALQPVHLIEEGTSGPQGKEYLGQVVWRSVQVRDDSNGQKDIAIRGDIDVPDLKFKMSFAIRRNHDSSVPASHLVELTFIFPPDFSGGSVEKAPGIMMKSNEQARGTPLAGLAVKVIDGFFLVGLSNVGSDRDRNLQLLKEDSWFSIPLVYANNNRVIISIPKNEAGDRVFNDVFAAWERTAGEDAKVDTKANAAKSASTAQPFLGAKPEAVKTKTIHGDR